MPGCHWDFRVTRRGFSRCPVAAAPAKPGHSRRVPAKSLSGVTLPLLTSRAFGSRVPPGLAVALARQPLLQELHTHIPASHSTLHHHERLTWRQTAQRVDQHVAEGSHRAVRVRRQDQFPVGHLILGSYPPAVVDMTHPGRRHSPKPVEGRRADARQDLPAEEQHHVGRGRGGECIQSPGGLRKPSAYCPTQGGIADAKLGQHGPPGHAAA